MKTQTDTNFDVIIIGGGIAGLSAALWCVELGLSALVLEKHSELGGQLLWIYNEIKNYPGREAKNGRELRGIFLEQIEKRDFELLLRARIGDVDLEEKKITLAEGTVLKARAIVIATGIRRRKLNVQGEDQFIGRGIIESGKKHAEQVAGKNVLIVGGGDAAFENALILGENAAKVTLVHRRNTFRAREEFISQVENHPKIQILPESEITGISGDQLLETVEIRNVKTGISQKIQIHKLLIRIGVEPNTEMFRPALKTDANGYIEIDRDCQTNIENIFAVGDVANPLAPTISSASGMGATAAKTIFSLLNY